LFNAVYVAPGEHSSTPREFAVLQWFQRFHLGPAADVASDLRPDVALLASPGRAPDWSHSSPINVHLFNTEADFVEPFFNHLEGDTRRRIAA
jgi:hypothetical protein